MNSIYSVESLNSQRAIGRLLTRVRHALFERLNKALEPLDLTAAQWGVVVLLDEGAASTPAELSRLLDYDPGAMTRLVDRLAKKGFIQRLPNPEDRRSVNLQLTPAGKALVPEIMPSIVRVYNDMLHGFEPAEAAQLEALLLRVLANG